LTDVQRTVSPVDGRLYVERPLATPAAIDTAVERGARAFRAWRGVPRDERIARVAAWIDAIEADSARLSEELTWQMGRPIAHSPYEIRGFVDRGRSMIRQADAALADIVPPAKEGFSRFVRREPLGLVLVLAPWNYPWLTAVNVIAPALIAGNTVLLKHSDQTPLVAERMVEHAHAVGIPEGVLEALHAAHGDIAGAVRDPRVAHVAFTGSVPGGRAVHAAAGGTFKTVGLELGGKDAAWVRADADLDFAAENIVEGVLFNAGQSCCAVERIYVDAAVFDDFVARAVRAAHTWTLGDPTAPQTTLGPMVRARNAATVAARLQAALDAGAQPLLDPARFAEAARGVPYLAPQLLLGLPADADLVREETFGPVCGILPVSSDAEALAAINASRYGLTASIWTRDDEAADTLAEAIDVGTVFQNRCDALDPELTWTGVRDSGRGATLGHVGFEALTRPKSYHLRRG
jgi:acyl-CoA reductase-like NAD-dependent aldehyde dehydrogenase